MTVSASVATRPANTATPKLLRSRKISPNVISSTPFCILRAAIAATNAFFICCSASGVRPFALGFVDVDASVAVGSFAMGRPYPSAKNVGLRKPMMPNGKSSSVPITSARHSAGGGRRLKRLRDDEDMVCDDPIARYSRRSRSLLVDREAQRVSKWRRTFSHLHDAKQYIYLRELHRIRDVMHSGLPWAIIGGWVSDFGCGEKLSHNCHPPPTSHLTFYHMQHRDLHVPIVMSVITESKFFSLEGMTGRRSYCVYNNLGVVAKFARQGEDDSSRVKS